MENINAGTKSQMLGVLPRRFTMTALFILCYTVVHINFEYNYWLTDDRDIFGKYEVAGETSSDVEVAKDVYFSKATWMFAMIWMMCFGMPFRSAIAYSFMLYGIGLLFLFPIRIYTLLNLLLAMGCVIEDVVDRFRHRKERLD